MFRMFWYEIKMDFLRSIRYRFGMISDLLVYFALFTVFMVTDSGNSYAQTYHYVQADRPFYLIDIILCHFVPGINNPLF